MSKDKDEAKVGGLLTEKDLNKCGRRWCMSVNGFNYETQLAPSVVFAEADALKKIYGDDDEGYRKSLENAARYFNVTPPVGGLLLGASLAIEEEGKTDALSAVQDLKVGLMGSLSGIGDAILWIMIPTIFGSIAAYMAQEGNPFGAILFALVMLVCSLGLKIKSWTYGYRFGLAIITTLADKIAAFSEAMSVLGLTVVGALIPSVVVINMPLSFTIGEVTFSVQEQLFDPILTGLLPILVTMLVYALIKRKVSTNIIIFGIIVVSWVCAAFGILA